MDPYSSGEDLVIKTRKPYTITKQRERWTEEEHNRFLEALKLYGRAWQRIEEHIGTKTAVQIRSHAQKFFTKLEKEAIVKGVSIGHALDIEIPPPRPKRKPSNPYPRKTSVGAPTSQVGVKDGKISNPVSSSCQSKMTVALEKEPEKPCDDGKLGNCNEYHEKDNCSEALTLLKIASCASPSSANKTSLSISGAPRKCTFRQYVPLSKEASNQDETAASQVTIEAKGLQTQNSDNKQPFQDNAPLNISNVVDSYHSHEKSLHRKRMDELKQSENVDTLPTADVQASQNYPRHVPVHILDGSLGMKAQNISPDMPYRDPLFHQMGGVHGHQNLFMNPAASATSEHFSNASRSSVHQSFPSHHPIFTPIQNQDDYQSFLHISSTFSSLIVSALSQNPAAYAAAGFAATLWPCVNMEAPIESSTASAGAFQSRPVSSSPSMAAIAAATVAAATAWWAAHGLLPLCAPFHPGFTCSPASASATPMDSSQGRAVNSERRDNSPDPALGGQQLEPECSEALHEQHSVSKSPILSSSDSEASEGAKLNVGLATAETAKVVDTAELHDANKSKNKKLVDRSSCGSNTPSSSEVEADASEKHTNGKEENHMKDKEESEELDALHPVGDPFSRRCRSISNVNDFWKEVSEEGRLAFQALFSREVLPQSFSPPHDVKNKGKKISNKDKEIAEEKDENGLQLDLNGKTWGTCSQKQGVEDNASLIGENKEEGLLNMGLGHAKLKARRTGFKPYKRCSMEAKESRVSPNSQDEEKGPKRLRMEGEAST
ncbi:hypothetical protein Pfo_005977 [Paulownia fortunei]|nr:hypothetical protein Pfo_005977 [Paulownia fortunei]